MRPQSKVRRMRDTDTTIYRPRPPKDYGRTA
jgi:hypothetical protein